jgi:hypothetical protein
MVEFQFHLIALWQVFVLIISQISGERGFRQPETDVAIRPAWPAKSVTVKPVTMALVGKHELALVVGAPQIVGLCGQG